MENPIYKFKEEQKELAAKIRSDKGTDYDSYLFRHNHIVYCEIIGRKRSQIEVPKDGNEPSEYLINKINTKWIDKIVKWRENSE